MLINVICKLLCTVHFTIIFILLSEPQNSPDPLGCYNCNGDIECFINKMEKRLWGFVYGTVELRVIDEHVMPQTW